ncbi:MAG: CHASE2 domain-containing protein [Phormidesmis sp. RL_2_1]|nr:CHASE2 domain-containing protein [Phormidesmis sp. RL_2_1]
MTRLYTVFKCWFPFWREAAPPSLFVILIILGLELGGWLDGPERATSDWLMRQRNFQTTSNYITLVTIDDQDLQSLEGYPVANADLAAAIEILQAASPRVVGISLLRHLSSTNIANLQQTLAKYPNVVGTEIALSRNAASNVPSPLGLSSTHIGFVDPLIDNDGKVRRQLLAARVNTGDLKYAFSLQLARFYLAQENIFLSPIDALTHPIRLGDTSIAQIHSGMSGYSQKSAYADTNRSQMLLDFSAADSAFSTITFSTITLSDLLHKRFSPAQIQDRIVMIGMAAPSLNNTFQTGAFSNVRLAAQQNQSVGFAATHNPYLYEIEIEAHATEQLLQNVLIGRPSIKILPKILVLLLIFLWSTVGIILGLVLPYFWQTFAAIACTSLILIFISFEALFFGWLIPIFPILAALIGASSITTFYNCSVRNLLAQHRSTVEQTFESIHNGPLQTLAILSRQIQSQTTSSEMIVSRLEILNQELRSMYEIMENQGISFQNHLFLDDNLTLNLNDPLSELLFQVTEHTLSRPFPAFSNLKACMTPDFALLDSCQLSLRDKRGLCLFLEEALCNIGKYGLEATYINVICHYTESEYSIEVINNHAHRTIEDSTFDEGYGSHQATRLAKYLNGHFQRFFGPNNTLHCQITWPKKQTMFVKITTLVQQSIDVQQHIKDSLVSNFHRKS